MFDKAIIKTLRLTSIESIAARTEEYINGITHNEKNLRVWRFFCRGGQIRTDDLLVPNQARYRATLRPENFEKPITQREATTHPDDLGALAPRDTGLR